MSTLIGFCAGFAFGGFGALVAAVLVRDKQDRRPLLTESRRNEILKHANEGLLEGIEKRNGLLAEMYPFTFEACPDSCVFRQECNGLLFGDECLATQHYREELQKLCIKVPE